MRLIDADALHNYMRARKKWVVKSDGKHNEGYTYDQVHFGIDAQPTVDAVPVIRCKGCKHSLHNQFTGALFCWLYNIAREVESDGYCYKAERREE